MAGSSSGCNSGHGNNMDISQVSNNQVADVSKIDTSTIKYQIVDGTMRMFEQVGAKAAAGIKSETAAGDSSTAAATNSTEKGGLRAFHWEKATDDQVADYNKTAEQGNGKTGQSGNGKVSQQNGFGKVDGQSANAHCGNGKVTGQTANPGTHTTANGSDLWVKHYDDSIKAA
jgi:hypothetical protein